MRKGCASLLSLILGLIAIIATIALIIAEVREYGPTTSTHAMLLMIALTAGPFLTICLALAEGLRRLIA